MSENEKDNKDFEFIKEQVIEKKRKKIKKLLFPTIANLGFAVLFGATAAVTFVIVEPRLYKFLHSEEETVTPVCFPTESPEKNTDNVVSGTVKEPTPSPVIVEQSIDADIQDYLSMNDDIREVAYQVNKSIVNISSTFAVEDWFGKSVDKVVDTTGIIVYNNTKNLLILVSLDRVKDAKSIQMVLSDSVAVDGELQDYESEINLAVIAVPIADIPTVFIDNLKTADLGESYTISVGAPVIALGSPNGYPDSMDFGIITSKGSIAVITDNSLDLFNTNIADNENSDGVIVNLEGKVIGLITRTLKEDINEDISTVIGISDLKPIIAMLGNKEPHIYFGVKTDNMTTEAKEEYGITNGIYVNEVLSDSPAFTAGLQKGDIILEINEHSIMSTSDFNTTISENQPGDRLNVLILRSSGAKLNEVTLKVTLADKSK